ncbi:hypothetical protein ACJJI4_12010 [Microbulbifer sp. TRSA002]|uniref:hypothetical protein n=1 Tax=Microbulbifer sp. TRSA002 TaxID=3243382 RepID=UPI0040390309
MRVVLFYILLTLVSGCSSTLSNLKTSSKQSHFTLQEDLYYTETRGLLEYKWLFGLRSGTYSLVAEDDDGYYYIGIGDTVLILSEERVEAYLESGEVPSYAKRYGPQFSSAGGEGGLWVPKNGPLEKAKIFWVLYTDMDDAVTVGMGAGAASSGGASGVPTVDGMVVGIVVTSVISSMANGALQFIELPDQSLDLQKINIVDTPASLKT